MPRMELLRWLWTDRRPSLRYKTLHNTGGSIPCRCCALSTIVEATQRHCGDYATSPWHWAVAAAKRNTKKRKTQSPSGAVRTPMVPSAAPFGRIPSNTGERRHENSHSPGRPAGRVWPVRNPPAPGRITKQTARAGAKRCECTSGVAFA